jgi:excisionase family DNA binding protein
MSRWAEPRGIRVFVQTQYVRRVNIVNHLRRRNTALTSAELCDLINVHPVTLREWTREGRIPAYRIGREWRYDPDRVADWLDDREVV